MPITVVYCNCTVEGMYVLADTSAVGRKWVAYRLPMNDTIELQGGKLYVMNKLRNGGSTVVGFRVCATRGASHKK